MTSPEGAAPEETLVLTAHLESAATPFEQHIKVGHYVLTCDEPAARGGADAGPSPTGLLLAALAGCTSITLAMYAARKGWTLGTVHVDLKLYRVAPSDAPAAGPPVAHAERVERTIRASAALTPEQRARLLEIAEKTPVTKMLKTGVTIATDMA